MNIDSAMSSPGNDSPVMDRFFTREAATDRMASRVRQRALRVKRFERKRRVSADKLPEIPGLLTSPWNTWPVEPLIHDQILRERKRAYESCEQRILGARASRDRCARRVREYREHLRTQLARVAEIKRQLASFENGPTDDQRELIRAEIYGMAKLPGVTDITRETAGDYAGYFCLHVEPRVAQDGKVYDLGDWIVRPQVGYSPSVMCVRSALTRTRPGVVTLSGDFCYGDRGNAVSQAAKHSQLVAAALTVEAIHGLNKYHETLYELSEFFGVTPEAATMPAIPRVNNPTPP